MHFTFSDDLITIMKQFDNYLETLTNQFCCRNAAKYKFFLFFVFNQFCMIINCFELQFSAVLFLSSQNGVKTKIIHFLLLVLSQVHYLDTLSIDKRYLHHLYNIEIVCWNDNYVCNNYTSSKMEKINHRTLNTLDCRCF